MGPAVPQFPISLLAARPGLTILENPVTPLPPPAFPLEQADDYFCNSSQRKEMYKYDMKKKASSCVCVL